MIFRSEHRMSTLLHCLLTVLLWGSSMLVGLVVKDLGVVLELTGSLSASILAYCLPVAIYFRLNDVSFPTMMSNSWNVWTPSHVAYKTGFMDRVSSSLAFITPACIFTVGLLAMLVGSISPFIIVEE